MRWAGIFTGLAVVIGSFAANALAGDPHLGAFDSRTDIRLVGHPSLHPRHGSHFVPGHPRHGGSHYRYGVPPHGLYGPLYGPPAVIYRLPGYPPVVYPPVIEGRRHVCRPGCGCDCGPNSGLYYRGPGWGLSLRF